MRKHLFLIALAAIFTLASVAPATVAIAQQQEEQPAQSVEGTLEAVDLEDSTVVVKHSDESEITLVVNEETVVLDASGEAATLADLNGREGHTLTASFVEKGDANVALTIQLVAE